MPEFVVEVTTKRTYGPYRCATIEDVWDAMKAGDLKMEGLEVECNASVIVKIKEVEPE